MLVSATYLKPRPRRLRTTLRLSNPIARAARDVDGFRGGRLKIDWRRGLWTVTVWSDRAAIDAVRAVPVHSATMPRLDELAGIAVFGTWEQEGDRVPRWGAVRARLADSPGGASVPRRSVLGASRPLLRRRRLAPAVAR